MSSKYERKHTISAKTDIRLLAGLLVFYKGQNIPVYTKSRLIGNVIEDFAMFLENKGRLKIPKTFSEALSILKQEGIDFLIKGGVLKSLADEEYESVSKEVGDLKGIAEKVGNVIAGK